MAVQDSNQPVDRGHAEGNTADPPRGSARSPWLVFVIVGIIAAALAAFLILRPGGTGTTQNTHAAPASSQQ